MTEQLGLLMLVVVLMLGLIVAIGQRESIDQGRALGSLIGRRLACAPIASDPCHRDPLTVTYGERLARLVRMLAPSPAELRSGGLVAVDFRYCRRVSCAQPLPGERGERLTRSNRRVTAFTEVRDRRRRTGRVEILYWLYRPGQPWQAIRRSAAEEELVASGAIRLGLDETPILVPLETLPGRNHYRFSRSEEPPWRWRVTPIFPGRPS